MKFVSENLSHTGVKGMKWGVIKEKETAYRQKLTNIQKKKNVTYSDAKLFKYRNQSAAQRLVQTGAMVAFQTVMTDMFSGRSTSYQNMSKPQLAKKVGKLLATTAATTAFNDALAKSASKRYDASGKQTKKAGLLTKEDVISSSVGVGIAAATLAGQMGVIRVAQAKYNRAQNEAAFNKMGRNILASSVDQVVWSNGNSWVTSPKK